MTATREYRAEDLRYEGIVCQGSDVRPTRGVASQPCRLRDVEKVGRYKLRGGWWDVYECANGHRFGLRTTVNEQTGRRSRRVMDIENPARPPVFGEADPRRYE